MKITEKIGDWLCEWLPAILVFTPLVCVAVLVVTFTIALVAVVGYGLWYLFLG